MAITIALLQFIFSCFCFRVVVCSASILATLLTLAVPASAMFCCEGLFLFYSASCSLSDAPKVLMGWTPRPPKLMWAVCGAHLCQIVSYSTKCQQGAHQWVFCQDVHHVFGGVRFSIPYVESIIPEAPVRDNWQQHQDWDHHLIGGCF
jgi:hypothetical protein